MRTIAVIAIALLSAAAGPRQEGSHAVTISARRYAFSPARLEVHRGDIVRITLETGDIPHSFTIDALRICKRATRGQPVTFEFLAQEAGTFPFYCSLTAEDGCRAMRGELVVR
jgi:cytochrome c oxidase subunit II